MKFKVGSIVKSLYVDQSRCSLFESSLPFGVRSDRRRRVRRLGEEETVLVIANHPSREVPTFTWVEVLAHDGVFYVDSDYIMVAT